MTREEGVIPRRNDEGSAVEDTGGTRGIKTEKSLAMKFSQDLDGAMRTGDR
jgi:hypothetical protein